MKTKIRPEAQPYGMQALDLLAELATDLTVDFRGAYLRPAQRRLLAALGVRPVNTR